MSEEEDMTTTSDDNKKGSNVSRGGIAFAFVLAFIIAIVGVILGAIALAQLQQKAPETQFQTLQGELNTLTGKVNNIDGHFSNNYSSFTIPDLKLGYGWGLTAINDEMHFYGTNIAGSTDQPDCTYMFIKQPVHPHTGTGNSFFLVGTGLPAVLGGTTDSTCKPAFQFD